jgi:hypothetical protein
MIANSSMLTDQIDDYDDDDDYDDESEYEEDYSSSEDEEEVPPTGVSLLSPNSIEIRRAAHMLLLRPIATTPSASRLRLRESSVSQTAIVQQQGGNTSTPKVVSSFSDTEVLSSNKKKTAAAAIQQDQPRQQQQQYKMNSVSKGNVGVRSPLQSLSTNSNNSNSGMINETKVSKSSSKVSNGGMTSNNKQSNGVLISHKQHQPIFVVTSIRTELENDLIEISDAAKNVTKLLLISPIGSAIDGALNAAMDSISNSAVVAVSGAAWNFVGQMWDEVVYE